MIKKRGSQLWLSLAAQIQPNSFWFWEKYHCFFMFFSRIACILVSEVSKKQVCGGNCSQ